MNLNKEERIFGWAEELLKKRGSFVVMDPFKGNLHVLYSYYPHDTHDDSISIFAIFGGYDILISEIEKKDLQEQNLEWVLIRDVTYRHSHKKRKGDLFYKKRKNIRAFYNKDINWYETFKQIYLREVGYYSQTPWKHKLQAILSKMEDSNS